jgi:hypothetical protein
VIPGRKLKEQEGEMGNLSQTFQDQQTFEFCANPTEMHERNRLTSLLERYGFHTVLCLVLDKAEGGFYSVQWAKVSTYYQNHELSIRDNIVETFQKSSSNVSEYLRAIAAPEIVVENCCELYQLIRDVHHIPVVYEFPVWSETLIVPNTKMTEMQHVIFACSQQTISSNRAAKGVAEIHKYFEVFKPRDREAVQFYERRPSVEPKKEIVRLTEKELVCLKWAAAIDYNLDPLGYNDAVVQ